MSQEVSSEARLGREGPKRSFASGCFNFLYKNALLFILLIIVGVILFSLARMAVYKIRPYERGLHLRGGKFIGIDMPGWHIQIPFVDTVIGVVVSERQGIIEQISAMTADDVTMDVSLLFTYKVDDPVRYALEVTNPEPIVSGFVEATLRDVINTKEMAEVMHSRAEINQEVMAALTEREAQYGVNFILVQIQSASPPAEVVKAIKDRMVAVQLQEKASAEAAQNRTLADSEFYAAQKRADGAAYETTKLAEAEAERITLISQAQRQALHEILQELKAQGELGDKYIQVLIAQELRENSKWVISDGEAMPILDLREGAVSSQPVEAP